MCSNYLINFLKMFLLMTVQYHIYVCQKINRGLENVASGNTISEEEFEKRIAQWIEP